MKCPKCQADMKPVYYKGVEVDRCTACQGIWFDSGEAERLKGAWMAEYIDPGNPKIGVRYDRVAETRCPRCNDVMENLSDKRQPHIWYESCPRHGRFFDAGEFTDWIYLTPLDKLRDIAKGKRPKVSATA